MNKKLVIRFDGPPSHESGRFIEVELDGASVSYGEWEQDGDDWLLVLPDADTKCAELEIITAYLLKALKEMAKGEGAYSRDPLTHAGNVITNMKVIANEAIHKAEE